MQDLEKIKEFYKKTIKKNPSLELRRFFLNKYNRGVGHK